MFFVLPFLFQSPSLVPLFLSIWEQIKTMMVDVLIGQAGRSTLLLRNRWTPADLDGALEFRLEKEKKGGSMKGNPDPAINSNPRQPSACNRRLDDVM